MRSRDVSMWQARRRADASNLMSRDFDTVLVLKLFLQLPDPLFHEGIRGSQLVSGQSESL
jgi:hypothetical protein